MHICSALQSAFAVHAALAAAWQPPPWAIDIWRQAVHVASGFIGVAAQTVAAHSVMQTGAPPSAPVPMHAQATTESWMTFAPAVWFVMQH